MKRGRRVNWRQPLKGFGIRFAISLVVLGGVYLLIFGWPGTHKRPLTPAGKIAAIRSALDETYLAASNLASFDESSPVAAYDLAQVYSQFQVGDKDLQEALKAAPPQVSPDLRKAIQKVLDLQQGAMAEYQSRSTALGKIAAYDPSSDLAAPSVTKSVSVTAQRANAAQKGLEAVAEAKAGGGASGLGVTTAGEQMVGASTKELLQKEAACFGTLAKQASAKDVTGLQKSRAACIAAYPALRRTVIHDIARPAFAGDYQKTMQTTIPPLLTKLDDLLKD